MDMINHPPHYGGNRRRNPYEHVKVCKAWGLDKDAFLYNCTKYLCRLGKKPGADEIEDLKKAAWYLKEAIRAREEARAREGQRASD